MNEAEKPVNPDAPRREPYTPPTLRRWGSLREITRGGGGNLMEIKGGPSTRF